MDKNPFGEPEVRFKMLWERFLTAIKPARSTLDEIDIECRRADGRQQLKMQMGKVFCVI